MRQSSRPSTASVSVEWEPDSASSVCRICSAKWGIFTNRRHHCRKCGRLVCNGCSKARVNLTPYDKKPSRTCDDCLKPPPPIITQPIEFVRAKTRIPFSDESPTLLGSPEAIFRKSLIADNARVASVIEESEKSLLMDLSNRTGNEATESALLDAAQEDEEIYSDEEEDGASGSPLRQLLDLKEMGSHLSIHNAQVSSPISEGGDSYLSESTDPPAALEAVKEGQADVRARTSVGKALRLSISKFGVMSFTDDEESAAAPSTMSFYEGSVNTFPLSPDTTLDLQDVLSPVSAPIVASKDDAFVVVQPDAPKEAVSDSAAEDQKEGSVHLDNLTPNEPPKEDNSTQKIPSSPETNNQAGNSAVKGTPKVVLKGTSNNAPNTQKLTPGLSPMPSGNTVRRLSTLAPRGSPYTMTTKSSAAVTSLLPAMAVPSDDAAISVANAGAEVSVETSASASVVENASGAAELGPKVVNHNNTTNAITSVPDATFAATSVKQLFTSVESESVNNTVDTTRATNVDNTATEKSETEPLEEPVEEQLKEPVVPAASPRDFRLSSGDANGVVSDTKKLKGGKHRNANKKGRGLKM